MAANESDGERVPAICCVITPSQIRQTPTLMSIVKRAISRLPGLRLIVPLGRMLFPVKSFAGSAAYWEERYRRGGNSGAGSYGKLAEFKAEVINDFVASTFTASVG